MCAINGTERLFKVHSEPYLGGGGGNAPSSEISAKLPTQSQPTGAPTVEIRARGALYEIVV